VTLDIPEMPDLLQADLVPLFQKSLQRDDDVVRFRQGTVVEWNTATGANKIRFMGATVENMPMLNSGEAIALKAGHNVGILTTGKAAFILGRITLPGSADFASASVAFGSAGFTASNFAVAGSGTLTVIGTTTLTVPAWADEALVMVTSTGGITNPSAAVDYAYMTVGVNGGSGGSVGQPLAPTGNTIWQDTHPIYASTRNLLTGLTTAPSKTITIEARAAHAAAGTWAANVNNSVFVHAIAIYRSTD
jgi:hypothetical protein